MIHRLLRFLGLDLMDASLQVMRDQQALIMELQTHNLELLRTQRDLVAGWRISVEMPEIDVRDNLDAMLESLLDDIARLEEKFVV